MLLQKKLGISTQSLMPDLLGNVDYFKEYQLDREISE